MATLTDFNGSVNVAITWNAFQDLSGLQTTLSATGTYSTKNSWSFGDDTGQAANVFFTTEILAGGTSAQIDLTNLMSPQSNVNVTFGYGTVVALVVEFIPNEDGTAASSGIRVGGASSPFEGWWSAGTTQDIDTGGLPVVMGGNGTTGKVVGAGNKNLKILNLDASNEATVRVTVFGVQNNF